MKKFIADPSFWALFPDAAIGVLTVKDINEAARLAPEQAAAAVRGHEMEHVYREQAKAQREDRKVVSQNVTYHTAICPECGRAYISGGTTRTVTAAESQAEDQESRQNQEARIPFSAVA